MRKKIKLIQGQFSLLPIWGLSKGFRTDQILFAFHQCNCTGAHALCKKIPKNIILGHIKLFASDD